MGYQPVLDGIRTVAVIAVILYHAGFDWMHGGFFGVEVFFVVSGYLITSLLLDERRRSGRVSLRQFWMRRARRLLPALFTMLVAVSLWASFFGEQHLAQLRKDMLPAAFYVGNWGQIVGDVPYFSTEAPLLRHVWSLAVEEQWYLLWPLAFVGLVALVKGRAGDRRLPVILTAASIGSMLYSVWMTVSDAPMVSLFGQDPQRYNFLYLNTLSRASGLLLGASMAFWWRPWNRTSAGTRRGRGHVADAAGVGAMVAIVAVSMTRDADILSSASLYRLWLPLVTVLSAVAVGAMVDPAARLAHRVFASRPLAEVGKRSYGLYLWHWPIFVFAGVRTNHARFIPAILLAVVVAEVCYRFVETPIRGGALRTWWVRVGDHSGRERRTGIAGLYVFAAVVLGGAIGARLVTAQEFDVARDESEVAFDPSALVSTTVSGPSATATAPPGSVAPTDARPGSIVTSTPATGSTAATGAPTTGSTAATGAPATGSTAATTAPTTTAPLPRRMVIVGDSQAHSLAINLPSGIERTFAIADGSVEGCGVLDEGRVLSARSSFRRSLTDCAGWQRQWGAAAAGSSAQLALVVIGAWEVFDIDLDGTVVAFGTARGDQLFLDGLRSGIDALGAAGAHVALLEVPCMRPQDVKGAGVPALPERGDDGRVRHLNDLMREVAAADPGRVTFVAGPTQWCQDPAIASDLGYRWDGVHVYKPGAKLIYETIAASLLAIAV